MRTLNKSKLKLGEDALDFIDLYLALQPKAENFLPPHYMDLLKNFYQLCHEEPEDPAFQQKEVQRQLLMLKEAFPSYGDVSLMLFPHEESKAFQYRSQLVKFRSRLVNLMDTELINDEKQEQAKKVLGFHDFSMGTPPFTQANLKFRFRILLGDEVTTLRRFREVLGIYDDREKLQWNYLMDVLEQMVVQSAHYTTRAEKADFLERMSQSTFFKGLNGLLNTAVSGSPETVIRLLKEELFHPSQVVVVDYENDEQLYQKICENNTAIFAIKVKSLTHNPFGDRKWFPFLSRMIFVDDSPVAVRTNISLVFSFHNKIIQSLDKVHTKKLGALANSQMNLRLILEKVSDGNLLKFKKRIDDKIVLYEKELEQLKLEQLGVIDSPEKNLSLFKFDEFSRQIIKDRYALTKLSNYLDVIIRCSDGNKQKQLNKALIESFEERTLKYFYSGTRKLYIATIVEGGGRNQIKTYGDYLLQRKLKPISKEIVNRCRVILNLYPDTYQRTLKNHFHKNFGINLFLEKYKQYLVKAENEADNEGRLKNVLIDLGVLNKYNALSPSEQQTIKEFISNLSNLKKTSISDDVQMIIRDVLFGKEDKVLKPYILFNKYSSWEYLDLFPTDRFDINPFDLEIGITPEGRIDFDRLTLRLERMKNTFQIFDETGNLWDRFCENLTIVINDPANPSGYSDFNNPSLLEFLKFISTSKITLFLDEAYNDTVKTDDPNEPKWRTISRYVMDNLDQKYARLNMVSSISTTKNLGATGDRLGSIVATPAKKEVIEFARRKNNRETGNTNSLYMLVNVLETAQQAKRIKNILEEKMPRNASRHKIKRIIEQYIIETCTGQNGDKKGRRSLLKNSFEGSPLHLFLLNELVAIDKLNMLELPDDFKYKDEPFFAYYQKQLVSALNGFRVNKNFRNESLKRLEIGKETARELLKGEAGNYARVVASDGSFLFNIQLKQFFSYQDLEKFTKKLAEQRGIAAIPYQTGFLRFSLGDYLEGTEASYDVFRKEIRNALEIVLKYWKEFYEAKNDPEKKEYSTDELLDEIFALPSERAFIDQVLEDFYLIRELKKKPLQTLLISNRWTLYHAAPVVSGVSTHSIDNSDNAVIEFTEELGRCATLPEFIQSTAFTSIYENLLPQVYQKIPAIKHWPFSKVLAFFGKSTLLKYIANKLNYEPNYYVLDAPDEALIMAEILLEMEQLLFSPSKTKIIALRSHGDHYADIARMEGQNRLLRKFIQELMLHFNLPFENDPSAPSMLELFQTILEKLEEISGIGPDQLDPDIALKNLGDEIYRAFEDKGLVLGKKLFGDIENKIHEQVHAAGLTAAQRIVYLYLIKEKSAFKDNLLVVFLMYQEKVDALQHDREAETLINDFLYRALPGEWPLLWNEVIQTGNQKVPFENVHQETRWFVLFLIKLMNSIKANEHYYPYVHSVMRLSEVVFRKQNSAINEMAQHGISVYEHFDTKQHVLAIKGEKSLMWIPQMLSQCGVIGTEQNIQSHTRIVTDSKKREFPYHRLDRLHGEKNKQEKIAALAQRNSNEYIKVLDTRPMPSFFMNRVQQFIGNMDAGDYRCKIFNGGLVNELFVFHKSYMKYLADNLRLMQRQETTLEEIQNFIPDTICFYGFPEKLISFPQIGYFDIPGPRGNIKTIVTPLRKEVDYFGNIKKPRLTVMNEKIKEMGGIPVHGSMFAVEEEDGAVFVVQISGDSGVGKSEMLAAMMLKWMRKNLTGVRSLKMIAGDMLHLFPDEQGNLYGIGTEEGDFSRVTDFDPDYIKYYYTLFESASDSNVEDLNSRSTISGLCDVSMPFKIDIMLTASNFAREEAGITRYENPENFILYRNSHGERMEKATSGDNPHFQRTLLRYTGDKNIVDVMDRHGAYIDDVLDWEYDDFTGRYYLCSSYKMIDQINLEEIVNNIFAGKAFCIGDKEWTIIKVDFDIIKNRFVARIAHEEEENQQIIDRSLFNTLFNSLASTPAGQPFVAEEGEFESKKHLIGALKNGQGKKVQLGILSTDLGRKGKEITGPQMAAEDMRRLIREVRNKRPDINENKNRVKQLVREKYGLIMGENAEIDRYNFWLWQMEEMRKASLVRIDNQKEKIDLSNLKSRLDSHRTFQPLLVTPNMNREISAMSETYKQLLQLPHMDKLVQSFLLEAGKVYKVDNYNREIQVNNVILQLLLLKHHILSDDLSKGRLMHKTDRETLAAAKQAALEILKG